jgi:hypothetical protein
MLVSVCLLGSNLNVHAKPENIRPSEIQLTFKSLINIKVFKKSALAFHEMVTNWWQMQF